MIKNIIKAIADRFRTDRNKQQTANPRSSVAAGNTSSTPHADPKDKKKPPRERSQPRRRGKKEDPSAASRPVSRTPQVIRPEDRRRPGDPVEYFPLDVPELPALVAPEHEEGKVRFHDLSLRPEIIAATQDLGFKYCTPVQSSSIPTLLEGSDIIGKAQTGTGKTAAFLTAIYNRFLNDPKSKRRPGTCRALVLAPTRELAIQIHKDAEALGKYCGFHNLVVFGGMDHKKQMSALHGRGLDILIGTPGRLIDYMRGGQLKLEDTEVLVIDEADRMLDMGFIPDVTRIVSRLPAPGTRQTLFFSATFTPEVRRLADRWLKNPVTVEIEPESVVAELIDQRFYSVLRDDKFNLLYWLITNEDYTRILIFGNRRDYNSDLAARLQHAGIKCELLSGDVPQEKRLKVLERFRRGEIKVLVATDVAARGIHVDGISHVVNYDLPEQAEDYVHRIGRTGRAGMAGTSISFICEYGAYSIDGIEAFIGHPIQSIQPSEEMIAPPPNIGEFKRPRRERSGGGNYGGGGSGGPRRGGRPSGGGGRRR